MYLDFTYYVENGGTITEESAFNIINRKAQQKLNFYTFNRLANTTIDDEIKLCLIDVINFLDQESKNDFKVDGVSVKSASNNGISIAYNTKTTQEVEQEVNNIINYALANYMVKIGDKWVNILYRGINI